MSTLQLVTTIIYLVVAVILTVIVLMQEGRSAGMPGAISGIADTYWGKNKGRSMEGKLEMTTRILGILFVVIAALLSFGIIK
ncbi:MAG: preprotein translocase subunit SecG [Lachnospiraceae bacterium]